MSAFGFELAKDLFILTVRLGNRRLRDVARLLRFGHL